MNRKIILAVAIQVFSMMALQADNQNNIAREDFGGERGGEMHSEGRGGYQGGGRGYEGKGAQGHYDGAHPYGDHPYGDHYNGINGGGSVDVIAPVPDVVEPNVIEENGGGYNSNNPYL